MVETLFKNLLWSALIAPKPLPALLRRFSGASPALLRRFSCTFRLKKHVFSRNVKKHEIHWKTVLFSKLLLFEYEILVLRRTLLNLKGTNLGRWDSRNMAADGCLSQDTRIFSIICQNRSRILKITQMSTKSLPGWSKSQELWSSPLQSPSG